MRIMQIQVPDYDEMIKVAEHISSLIKARDTIKNQIEFYEGQVLRNVNSDTKYFINGKPPATNFVEKAYFNMLFDDINFPKLREDLVTVNAELEKYKMVFDIMKQQITLFQTESANKRNATI